MVDLHCHILPCIDDGPQDVEGAVALVRKELADGVDTIAVTPHFIKPKQNIEDFCARRQKSLEVLQKALEKEEVKIGIVLGAEVALCVDLPQTERIERLLYAGTDFMLVELPGEYYYDWIPETLYQLRLMGITPILAHIERCHYLIKETKNLCELVDSGCLAQMNAPFLLHSGLIEFPRIRRLMERRLAHLVATDSHSLAHRPPLLGEAMEKIQKKWGKDAEKYFCENAQRVLGNQPVNEGLRGMACCDI